MVAPSGSLSSLKAKLKSKQGGGGTHVQYYHYSIGLDAPRSDVVLVDVEGVGVPTLYAALLTGYQGRPHRHDLSRMLLLLALEWVRRQRWRHRLWGRRRWRPRAVVYAGVHRWLLRVAAATYDYATVSVSGAAVRVAAEARQAAQAPDARQLGLGARRRRQRRGPRQTQLRVRHLAAQLKNNRNRETWLLV